MTYLPAALVLLVILLLVMAMWSYSVMGESRKLLVEQLEEAKLQVIRQEKELARLTTIIASKDPMTFQVLSAAPMTSFPNSEEVPYETEEMEARRWAIQTGKIDPDSPLDDDMTDDLRMLGL